MAGEFAAIDSVGTLNAIGFDAGVFDRGFMDAVGTATGMTMLQGTAVLAAPMVVLTTPDGVPFGVVEIPLGWDVKTQGLPPGANVGWNMGNGVSIIYDGNGREIGQMVSPISPLTDVYTLPVVSLMPYYVWTTCKGRSVGLIPHRCLVATSAIWVARKGCPARTLWSIDMGRNYGGPDGGASNF